MRKIIRILAVVSMGVVLAACNGVFERSYTYHAPVSVQGKSCVERCQKSRQKCDAICVKNGRYCQCEADYRACFELCGGQVAANDECVGNNCTSRYA